MSATLSFARSAASAILATALIGSSLVAATPAVAANVPASAAVAPIISRTLSGISVPLVRSASGTLSIGNRVFRDDGYDGAGGFNAAQRNDGLQGSSEVGVNGVLVTLYEDTDPAVTTDPLVLVGYDYTEPGTAGVGRPGSDLNGYYLFDTLEPGTYIVTIPPFEFVTGNPLAGWHSSTFNGTETVGAAGATGSPATDLDDNGIEPANRHPEISGVSSAPIVLTAGGAATGETDLSLQADTGVPINEGFDPTGWDGADSIGRGSVDTGSNMAVDFGFIPPMSIGNRVWLDDSSDPSQWSPGGSRNNGLIDATDDGNLVTAGLQNPGIANVDLQLYLDANNNEVIDAGDALISSATSNSAGYYLFDGLAPGNYIVRVPSTEFGTGQPLAGLRSSYDAVAQIRPTNQIESNDNGIDGNEVVSGTSSQPIALVYLSESSNEQDLNGSAANGIHGEADNDSDLTIDFGFVRTTMSLGNQVWLDTNNNALKDAAEAIVSGVEVALYRDVNANGNADAGEDTGLRTITDVDGFYLFDNIPPGNYLVAITSDNFPAGGPLAGKVNSRSVSPNPIAADNQVDNNDNGRDAFVSGIGYLSSMITLSPSTEPSGETPIYAFSGRGRHGERDADSDLSVDFGFTNPSVRVGDFVWNDTNRNGVQNAGEPGIAGVAVTIVGPGNSVAVDANGTPVPPTTTDAAGAYSFPRLAILPVGQTYTVKVDTNQAALVGYSPTLTGQGTAATDSSTSTATAAPGSTDGGGDVTVDFGFVSNAVVVGDFVWNDLNRNGVQNAGEPGLSGIGLTLVGPTGLAVTDVLGNAVGPVTTASTGAYSFNNLPSLPAGQHYTVKLDNTQAALGGFVPTLTGQGTPATDSSTGSAESGNLSMDGASDPTLDFGFVSPAVSVGDFVWVDSDENGIQNAAEPGIAGVTVTIAGPGGVPALDTLGATVGSVITGGDGSYTFSNLRALPSGQSYTVSVDNDQAALAGYVPTVTGQGTTATDSSNGSASSGNLIANGASNLTLDFGFAPLYAVGDFVWSDTNRNGRQDAGEPGLEGVTVELLSAADAVLATTTSDPAGYYVFDSLRAATYTVRFGTVDDFSRTTAQAAIATAASDSDPSAATGVTPAFTLAPSLRAVVAADGVTARFITTAIDAGYRPQSNDVSIAHTAGAIDAAAKTIAWNVTVTNDGPDATSTPISVSSTLASSLTFESDDSADVTCTTTGQTLSCELAAPLASGASVTYSFVTSYTGYPASLSNTVTAANAFDTNSTNDSATATATAFPPKVAVGNFVWSDTDRDGIQDAGEPGIAGVVVKLLSGTMGVARHTDGSIVTYTTTDANGFYAFDDLAPGSYIASSGLVTGAVRSPLGGGTAATDSDFAANGMTAAFTVAATATGDTRAVVASDGALDATLINHTIDAGFTTRVFDVSVVKDFGSVNTSMRRVTWNLTVANSGPDATAAVVTVTDVLPSTLTFVSGGSVDVACTTSGQTVTCVSAAPLASGATLTFPIVTKYSGYPRILSNTASVAAGPGDTDAANDSSSATTPRLPSKPVVVPPVTPTNPGTGSGSATGTVTPEPTATATPEPTVEPTDEPTATPEPTDSATPAAPTAPTDNLGDDVGSTFDPMPLILWALGAILLIVLATGAIVFFRRRVAL